MEGVMNKCFLLNSKLAQIRHVLFEKKCKNCLTLTHSNSEKNDVTESKARLGYSNR